MKICATRTFVKRFPYFISEIVVKHSFLALLDQAFYSITNFLTGVIIGRTCSKDQYGLYFLGFSIVLFVVCIQSSLISSPFTVFYARLKNDRHAAFIGSTLVHQIVLSVSAIFIFIIVSRILSFGIGPPGLTAVVKMLSFVITFILLREYVRRICFATLKLKTALILDIYVSIIQIGGLFLLAKKEILSASSAYLPIGVASFLAASNWFIRNKKLIKIKFKCVIEDLAKNWAFGKWIFAGNIILLISSQIYAWLLSSFHGTIATGVFAACWTVVNMIRPTLAGITNILGPKAAHALTKGTIELHKLVIKFTIFLTIIMSVFCLLILLFGEHLIVLIYGNKYAGNGTLILILALGILVEAGARGMDYGIWAMEQSKINFIINLVHLTFSISIGSLFVNIYGPLGAAMGLLLSNSIASIGRYFMYTRIINSFS